MRSGFGRWVAEWSTPWRYQEPRIWYQDNTKSWIRHRKFKRPCLRQVAGEREIVVLLLLVAGEALGGGIGHRPLRLAAALERLEAPPAGRLEAGAVLLHDADELAAALDPGAILVLRLEEVEHEHAAVGERPALHERAHRLGVRVDVVQAAELGEQRVFVGIDDPRLDQRPLAVARRVGHLRLVRRGDGGVSGDAGRGCPG